MAPRPPSKRLSRGCGTSSTSDRAPDGPKRLGGRAGPLQQYRAGTTVVLVPGGGFHEHSIENVGDAGDRVPVRGESGAILSPRSKGRVRGERPWA